MLNQNGCVTPAQQAPSPFEEKKLEPWNVWSTINQRNQRTVSKTHFATEIGRNQVNGCIACHCGVIVDNHDAIAISPTSLGTKLKMAKQPRPSFWARYAENRHASNRC